MYSNMSYCLLAIFCLFLVSTLLTTFIGTAVLPFLDTSRQEVRDLFLALKDLALPMGSFPSRLLGCRTSEFVPQLFTSSLNSHTVEKSISEVTTNAISQETNEGKKHRMKLITIQPHIKSAPLDRDFSESAVDQDEVFLDTLEHQPCHIDETDTSNSGVERSLASEATEDAAEVFFDANQSNEDVPTYPPDIGESLGSIDVNLSRLATEKEVLEAIIISQRSAMEQDHREMVLVRWEASELRFQNNRREDEVYDAKQAFEAIIIGQNLAMQEDRQDMILAMQKASELKVENSELREAQENYEEREAEWRGRIRYAQDKAEGDRMAAEEAIAGVESRINQLKRAHEKEVSAAAFQSFQEKNSIICSRRMVQDDLAKARSQVIAWEQQYKATVKEKNIKIEGLNAAVRQLKLEVEVSGQLAESNECRLRKRLEEHSKEKDREICILKDQQRKLTKEVDTMSQRRVSAEHKYKMQSDLLREQKETHLEERRYIKETLSHDVERLERAVGTNEVTIQHLQARIIGLESGQAVEDLKTETQSHIHQYRNEIRILTKQVKCLELDKAGSERTSEDIDRDIQQTKEKWFAEVETLKQALNQTRAASIRYLRRTNKASKEKKRKSSRKLRAARSDVQKARAQTDRLEREQAQTAEQYQNAARDAVEVARRSLQAQFDDERRTHLENMKNETTKTERGLQTEIGALKSQIDRYTKAAAVASTTSAEPSPARDTNESASLARELDDVHKILEELEEQGLPRVCGERFLLIELNKARKALVLVKHEVQQAEFDKNDLLCAISEASINEHRFQQCDSRKRPILLAQARAANEKLQSLQKILRTDLDVQKDAVLEILQSPAKNETNNRQEFGDLNMADASQMQDNGVPGASDMIQPPRALADILDTLQKST